MINIKRKTMMNIGVLSEPFLFFARRPPPSAFHGWFCVQSVAVAAAELGIGRVGVEVPEEAVRVDGAGVLTV